VRLRAKRLFDLAAATIGLVALSPLLAAVAALTWLCMGRPVLFRQWRAGRDGRPFRLVKFRTMAPGPEPDHERLTPLGRWLRRTSLDELPGLWNVLVGQMSLVGPRPLLTQYVERYSPRQARRHALRPGITGLAQVKGRNLLSWEERLELDVWYVDHWSFGLDLWILALTIASIVSGRGVRHPGSATMPEFTGASTGRGVAEEER
jgi:lipopolysaccharide/colanic/teichoic acid biosynthesis glycosyltransferase